MPLRFLTRRRDRSTSTSNSLDSKPSSSSPLASPHDPFAKGKSAVPAQVQIISWDPRDLESSGCQVHIRSRADDTCSATPVYHAFTASSVRRGSDILTPPQASSTSSHSSPGHAPRHVQQTRVEAGAGTSRARLRTASSRSYDDQCSKPDSLHFKHAVSRLAASTLLDTPRSEHVELLQPSWPMPDRDGQEQRSSLIHSHTTPRPAESLPHHTKTAGYDDTLTDTEDASIYSGMPSSSRSHFASIHPSASVASLASFLSFGDGSKDTPAPASTELTKTASSSSSSFNNTLISRTPSTCRLRRSTNASSADIQVSASSTESGAGPSVAPEMIASRSRSSSLSSLTPKFLRSKQGAQAPSTPSGKSKRSRGAPPSAWRSDIASTATADMTSADGGGASSTYSSDNQGSSHGHGHQQEHTSSSTLGHLLSKVAVSAHVRKSSADAASDRFYHRSPASNTHRPLTATTDASSSPLLASSITAVDSPIISGLPLPDPTPASISLLVTSQLFKRLGPPPVGLEPHCFHERVALIQGYVQSQVPPPPCPKSPPQSVQRASLPPPPRKRRDVAALEDEFDKLECLAEIEMAKFASAGGVGLEELRLEEAFLEARRRSGVDWNRSHFELRSAVGAGSPRMRDAVPPGVSTSAGLGLLTHKDVSGAEGGLGVSLKPAPRTRRRPVIVGADAEDGKGKRPTTAPETEQGCVAAKSSFTSPRRREGAGQRELFTPQSFSSKPHQLHNTSIVDEARLHSPLSPLSQLLPLTQNPAPSSYTPTSGSGKQRRGSSDRDSSSSHTHQSNSSAGTSTQSPLFWNHHHAFRGGGRLKKEGREMDEGTEEGEGDETEDTASCESLSDATKVVQQQQALGDGVIW